MKFNSDGSLLFTKTFSNSFSNNKLEIKYFLFGWIQKFNDLVVMNGKVSYDQSALGFSPDSYIDQIVFTVDGGFNIKWASIFDYKLSIDTKNDFIIYEDIIYISDYAANYYPCFFSVNATDGTYLQSNLFTFYAAANTDSAGSSLYYLI